MTYGPFRPGDLSPELARNVPIGSFMLAEKGLYLVAKWPEDNEGPAYDVLFQFAPGVLPRMTEPLDARARCLVLRKGHLEASVAGVSARAEAGYLGINNVGEVALAFLSPMTGNTLFVHIGTGIVSAAEPQGFGWSGMWHLDLVLGEGRARIELAGN